MPDQLLQTLLKKAETIGPPQKPYTSPLQKGVDWAGRIFGFHPSQLDNWAKRLTPTTTDFHPYNKREGSVERIIKAVGASPVGTLIPTDLSYLEQYFHPDADVLPKTGRRPMIPVKGPQVYREPDVLNIDGGIKTNVSGMGQFQPWRNPDDEFKTDAYDVWDFDTETALTPYLANAQEDKPGPEPKYRLVNELIKRVLQGAGQPYSIFGNMVSGEPPK